MISFHIGRSAGEATQYFEKSFDPDGHALSDNYYANDIAPSRWMGEGAKMLGIYGQTINAADFQEKVAGKLPNPETGKIQDLGEKSNRTRLYYDLSVAPPKSVSIMALLAGDQRINQAFREANEETMQWLERTGAVARPTHNGVTSYEKTGNLVIASFEHDTSRDLDPQMHIHNVILAATYHEKNGKWYSLTNDTIMHNRMPADMVFNNNLITKLERLGYEIEYGANNTWEIAGFTRGQIEAFSSRREEVVRNLEAQGIKPDEATAAQDRQAVLSTRDRKIELPREQLQERWEDLAAEVGIDVHGLRKTVDRMAQSPNESMVKSPAEAKNDASNAVSWAIQHLSEREQAFPYTALSTMSLTFLRGLGVMSGHVEQVIEERIKSGELIDRGIEEGKPMLTTQAAYTQEVQLLGFLEESRNKGNVVLSDASKFESHLVAFEARKSEEVGGPYKLTAEQVNAAQNMLMHADGIQGVQGSAGTGKTAVIEFVKEVVEANGWRVVGMATSGTASVQLEAESGVTSYTVAMFNTLHKAEMKAVQDELGDIKASLARDGFLPRTGADRFITGRATFNDVETNYTLDQQSGEVYKAVDAPVPDTLRGKLGNALLQIGGGWDADFSRDREETKGFDRMLLTGKEVANKAGKYLLGNNAPVLQAVDIGEAIEVKSKLNADAAKIKEAQSLIQQKEAELTNLKLHGNKEGLPTLYILDEASLTGTKDALSLLSFATKFTGRVVLQGDIKQHASVAAGVPFEQLQKAQMNVSHMEETRRFDKATFETKEAVRLVTAQKFAEGLAQLEKITTTKKDLARTVAEAYVHSLESVERRKADPQVNVVALTNADRKAANAEIHQRLQEVGRVSTDTYDKDHFDDPKLTRAETLSPAGLQKAKVEALVFSKAIPELQIAKGDALLELDFNNKAGEITGKLENGEVVTFNPKVFPNFNGYKTESRSYSTGTYVEARAALKLVDINGEERRVPNGLKGMVDQIDDNKTTVEWNHPTEGKFKTELNNQDVRFVDLAYAHTSHKEQGQSIDREIIMVGEMGAKIINKLSSYVISTRAKEKTLLVTSDYEKLLQNAANESSKTGSLETHARVSVDQHQATVNYTKPHKSFGNIIPIIDHAKHEQTRQPEPHQVQHKSGEPQKSYSNSIRSFSQAKDAAQTRQSEQRQVQHKSVDRPISR